MIPPPLTAFLSGALGAVTVLAIQWLLKRARKATARVGNDVVVRFDYAEPTDGQYVVNPDYLVGDEGEGRK